MGACYFCDSLLIHFKTYFFAKMQLLCPLGINSRPILPAEHKQPFNNIVLFRGPKLKFIRSIISSKFCYQPTTEIWKGSIVTILKFSDFLQSALMQTDTSVPEIFRKKLFFFFFKLAAEICDIITSEHKTAPIN